MKNTALSISATVFLLFVLSSPFVLRAGEESGCPPSFSPSEMILDQHDNGSAPAWSPDLSPVCVKRGDAVVFAHEDAVLGTTVLYYQRRGGLTWYPPRILTNKVNYTYSNPQWSPDGLFVLYERKPKTGGKWNLFRVPYNDAATTVPAELPVAEDQTKAYTNAHWTSAGIVCEEEVSSTVTNIVKICFPDNAPVMESLVQNSKINKRPRWSPDGSAVVYARQEGATKSSRDIVMFETGVGETVVYGDGISGDQDDSPLWGQEVNEATGQTKGFVLFNRREDIGGTLTWHLYDIERKADGSWEAPRKLTGKRTEIECGEVFPDGFDHIKAVLAPKNQEKVLYVKRNLSTQQRWIHKLTRPPLGQPSPEAIDLLLNVATFDDNNSPAWAPNEDAIVWQRTSGNPLTTRIWSIDSPMP